MFSNLRQGNKVYVLELADRLYLKTGLIIDSKPNYAGSIDMKVKVDDNEYEFKLLPYNQTVAENGSIIVSENLDNLLNKVRTLKADCENKLNNIEYYKLTKEDCNKILRDNDESYNKELKRDEEINNLKLLNSELLNQILAMALSLSNIEKLLSDKK